MSNAERGDFERLIEVAVRRTRWWRRGWQFEVDDDRSAAATERRIREVARLLLRHSIAGQRYANVVRMWWPLAQRREAVDRIAPWSRVRFNRRQAALGILDGVEWDRLRSRSLQGEIRTARYVATLLGSAVRRARIRLGSVIFRDAEHVVDWNLTLAYACQVRAMEAVSSESPSWAQPIRRAVLRGLDRSMLAATKWLDSWELVDVVATSDLYVSGGTSPDAMERYVREWLWPLVNVRIAGERRAGRGGTRL
jgi:hypothetical protein